MDQSTERPCRSFTVEIDGQATELQISEVYSGDYGCVAWPSSVVLANLIARHSSLFSSATLLELGCGVGLPGIVAAKCGSHVHLTDVREPDLVLENCRDNCKRNHVDSQCHVFPLHWGHITKELLQLEPIDFVIGADLFYDSKLIDGLLATLTFLLQRNPACRFLFVLPERLYVKRIESYLETWELAYHVDYYDGNTTEQMVLLYSTLHCTACSTHNHMTNSKNRSVMDPCFLHS